MVNAIRVPTFELLQQGNFGVGFRSDLFDPPVIFRNPLVQRFDFRQPASSRMQ
jgi:hypothetical protein